MSAEEEKKVTETKEEVKEEKVEETKVEKTEEKKEEKSKEEAATPPPPPPPPPRVHKMEFERDVVYLFQFCRTPLLPSLSPYCLKVETWLRLNGIKYENVDHKLKFRSSKGQLPFVELNGEEIADSTHIISKLSQHFNLDGDQYLSKADKNVSHALQSMIENHLCWVYVHWRSKNPDSMIRGFKLSLQHALGSRIPNSLLNVVFKLTYSRKGAKKVKAHGLGLHTAEEILEFGKADVQVLEDSLGNNMYFFGENPSNLDVVAFAHLVQIYYVDEAVKYELRDWMKENCPNLVSFLTRMKERCFPDWEEMTTSLAMNTHIEKPKEEKAEVGEKEKEAAATEVEATTDEKTELKKEIEACS